MSKFYEKLKCFFSLNYQLKKIYLLSKQREEFYIDVTLYEYIVNPFLVMELLKIFLYKKSIKPLSSYTYVGYLASIPNLRKYFILSFKANLFVGLLLCTIVVVSFFLDQPFYIWILVFVSFLISHIIYYMYIKKNHALFRFCTGCDDDEKFFFEEWLNTLFIKFEDDDLSKIILKGKASKVRKRL